VYVLTIHAEIPTYKVNQMGGDMQCSNLPKSPTIHVNLRTENALFLCMRSLEVLVVHLIPKMQRCGAGCQHVDIFCALSAVLPTMRSRMLEVPAILESRIRLVRRTSVCGYG
jgi:hypothetical protein